MDTGSKARSVLVDESYIDKIFNFSVFFVSLIQTLHLSQQLDNINESMDSIPIELSMRLESYKIGNSNENIIDNKFYFLDFFLQIQRIK